MVDNDELLYLLWFVLFMYYIFDVDNMISANKELTNNDFIAYFMGQYAIMNEQIYKDVCYNFEIFQKQQIEMNKNQSNTTSFNTKNVVSVKGGKQDFKFKRGKKGGAFFDDIKNSIDKVKKHFRNHQVIPFFKVSLKIKLEQLREKFDNDKQQFTFPKGLMNPEITTKLLVFENIIKENSMKKIEHYIELLKTKLPILISKFKKSSSIKILDQKKNKNVTRKFEKYKNWKL
jgi:hypothetical protein